MLGHHKEFKLNESKISDIPNYSVTNWYDYMHPVYGVIKCKSLSCNHTYSLQELYRLSNVEFRMYVISGMNLEIVDKKVLHTCKSCNFHEEERIEEERLKRIRADED